MTTRNFHWSSVLDCVMHETDGSGNTLVTYTHEPSQYGPLLSENRGSSESYHHYDALGSTMMLTDDTGAVTDTFTYDAWGNEVVRTGLTDTPYGWCGRWGYQYDAVLGSYYVRARIHEPHLGRWASIDPIELQELYRYSRSSPVTLIDQSGLAPAGFFKQGMAGGWLGSVDGLEDNQFGFSLTWQFGVNWKDVPPAAFQHWQLNLNAAAYIDDSCSPKYESGVQKDVTPVGLAPPDPGRFIFKAYDLQTAKPPPLSIICSGVVVRSILSGFNQPGINLPEGESVQPDPREIPFLMNPAGPKLSFVLVYTYFNSYVCRKCLDKCAKPRDDDYVTECLSSPWGLFCKNVLIDGEIKRIAEED